MFRIYVISDRRLAPSEPAAGPLVQAIAGGAEMVQIREKDLTAREILAVAREVVAGSAGTESEVYVNSRCDIAAAAGAHGVHLPSSGARASEVRRAVKGKSRKMKIGVSTHSTEEARAAEGEGADFIVYGPVFDTPSKRGFGPPQGLRGLHEVLAAVSLPVYALGGIHPGNAEQVLALPVSGIAVVSAVIASSDRLQTIAEFRAAGRRARGGEA